MLDEAEIRRQLPYLRRFARALCGSQGRGDAQIKKLLEGFRFDVSLLRGEGSTRVKLYRALLHCWQTTTDNNALVEYLLLIDKVEGADRAVALLTPRPRQAFLLTFLEDLPRQEVMQILDVSEHELIKLLVDARREIAQQTASNVLIIEDETLIAIQLEQIATDLGHWVQGCARTRREAIEAIQFGKPDLILSDIQLADGSSGIEAVNDILCQGPTPVVFITAFPERLLTGHRPEPAYLVNKPFVPDQIQAAISQALFFNPRTKTARPLTA